MSWGFKRRRSTRKGLVKRARGNLKSSKSNTDALTQTITFTSPVVLTGKHFNGDNGVDYTSPTTGTKPEFYGGVVALNIWDLLSRAPNFKAFQQMYDQVRIDYASVTLNVTNSTIQTNQADKTYDIYTAWDRTGIDFKDLYPTADQGYNVDGCIVGIGPKITDYQHTKSTLNAFQRWKKSLYIYPKSLSEKSQYVSTGSVTEWRDPYNSTETKYPFKNSLECLSPMEAVQNYNNFLNSDNPAILSENGKFSFKPTLLIGAFGTNVVDGIGVLNQPLSNDTKIVMSADWKVVCTFRGAKGVASIT